jgi:hypothetical protein
MENLQVLESGLLLPVSFQELDREEMTYVDGGGVWTNRYYDIGPAMQVFLGVNIGSGGASLAISALMTSGKNAAISMAKGFIAGGLFLYGALQFAWGLANFIGALDILYDYGSYTINTPYIKVFGLTFSLGFAQYVSR